jgi:hypothetical protein
MATERRLSKIAREEKKQEEKEIRESHKALDDLIRRAKDRGAFISLNTITDDSNTDTGRD